jgi:glycosyltransferase involved in cell wall biosynthesis
MPPPLVSVCVPTFNGASYLAEALASIEAQDYPNIEIIVSDDGSADDTFAIAEKFAASSRFPCRIFRHTPDTLAGNWNYAASHASGEFLKYVFQDDIIYPAHIHLLVAAAEADRNVIFAFAKRDILFSEATAKTEVARRMKNGIAELHRGFTRLRPAQVGYDLLADPRLLQGNWNKIGEPTFVLIRRAAFLSIGGFDASFRQLIDLDLYFRLMTKGSVAFVDQSIGGFRVHDRQLSVTQAISGLSGRELADFARKMVRDDMRCHFHRLAIRQLEWTAEGNTGSKPGWLRSKRLAIKAWLRRLLGIK